MNRRALLGAAAAAGLAGCGAAKAPDSRMPVPTATATPAPDAELLRPLIELKARAVAIYAGHAGLKRLRAHERVHLARLLEVVPGRPHYAGIRSSPAELELEMLAAQLAILPRLGDPRLRTLLGGMYATDAEHLAALRRAAGRDPVVHAFVTGRA